MTDKPLHIKYRPRKFDDVLGQDEVVKALRRCATDRSMQAFVLAGPSGVGKTTLARITSRAFGCSRDDLIEIDAATYTGVDAMRAVQQALQYVPFERGAARAVIIDECHALSKAAWQSLLKIVEEPPPHALFFFCTTEASKIPATIKTRCAYFTLRDVSNDLLRSLIEGVAEREHIQCESDILDVVASQAFGSPRQALVNLEMVRSVRSKKEALRLLEQAAQNDGVRALCQFLLKGGSWAKATALVDALKDENPESVRINVVNYMVAVLKNSKTERAAMATLRILDAFSTPYNASDRSAPLYLSVAAVLFDQ